MDAISTIRLSHHEIPAMRSKMVTIPGCNHLNMVVESIDGNFAVMGRPSDIISFAETIKITAEIRADSMQVSAREENTQ